MKLVNIREEDRKRPIEEVLQKRGTLTFTNDLTDIVLTKNEEGFDIVGYTGYEYNFEWDSLENVLEVIDTINDSYDMFTNWADDYLNSIENFEFIVTSNTINMIYLAKQIQNDQYTYNTHHTHGTDIRHSASEIIDEYFEAIEEEFEQC